MATSKRQSVVDAIETRLQTIAITAGYETDLGRHIFVWRPLPIEEADLPAAIVRDTDSPTQVSFGLHEHAMTVEVELFAAGNQAAKDIRTLVADVTKAISTDRTFGGLAEETTVTSEDFIVEQASRRIASALLRYQVVFTTALWDAYT